MDILTIEETSAYLKLSKKYIYTLTSKQLIPFRRIGGLRFIKTELDTWVQFGGAKGFDIKNYPNLKKCFEQKTG